MGKSDSPIVLEDGRTGHRGKGGTEIRSLCCGNIVRTRRGEKQFQLLAGHSTQGEQRTRGTGFAP